MKHTLKIFLIIILLVMVRKESDGYIRITERMDDVLNVSGHRMGNSRDRSTLDDDPRVAETAVVGFNDIKGEGICFCILRILK